MARRIVGAALLAVVPAAAAGAVPTGFAHHFSCPFARVWLEHGAEKAAKILGIEPHAGASAAGDVPRCTPAPGYPGGAHQHARSPGYSTNCSGTPAQGSPYMWPLRWKASQQSTSMSFGTNNASGCGVGGCGESTGMAYYRFDKNWKRGDEFSASGSLKSTVLHKNDKMTFIAWDNATGTKITSCSWMNMTVIGNLRPDWFLDGRGGGAIDAQYLGKEHVYYRGKPRLVRKWRKNDFVNTVFTVSIDEYGDNNGTRWPLILNIPGEEAGPDSLRQHWDHEVLADDDLAPFLIDEAHIAAGGKCPTTSSGGGPPSGINPGHKVPSALEKDVNGWRSVEWTASTVAPAPTPAPPATPAPACADTIDPNGPGCIYGKVCTCGVAPATCGANITGGPPGTPPVVIDDLCQKTCGKCGAPTTPPPAPACADTLDPNGPGCIYGKVCTCGVAPATCGATITGGPTPFVVDDYCKKTCGKCGTPATPPPPPAPQQDAYVCGICRHVYDAANDGGNKPFEQLPDAWVCPVCGAPKSAYSKANGVWAH